ncbi:TlpA family protein disulfide reductase [Mucilaginibacter sp. HMF5004]|uniref:TlpA family protein disulfide reductase n=1 Tax=Mucilaginibacter rivuli TaxID=2857527 RepID=UPI001C60547F|nr:TlpA disulfide reductase family protein [Mucilaginibacter rivuli]MBW4888944.1 TlpA family protein disulfide reductase [Mucilaginibacter rivuli]
MKMIRYTIKLTKLFMVQAIFFAHQAQASNTHVKLAADTFLHVGDKIPYDYFAVDHYPNKQLNFSELQGKLVILDLWAIYCSSCIDHMPEMVNLQKQFDGKVQVIMVTKNSRKEVSILAARSDNVRNNTLPSITGEQRLVRLFDYTYVPTHIWIDGNGIIRYITDGKNTTAEHIADFLAGKALDFKEKTTIGVGRKDDPLLVQMYPYFGNNFMIYSYLAPRDDSKYKMGGFKTLGLNVKGSRKILSGNSFSFIDLYKIAYGFSPVRKPLSNSRVSVRFNDTAGYADPKRLYIYELIANQNISGQRLEKYIQTQLDLFFNVKSSIQKKVVPCYIFKQLPGGLNVNTNNTGESRFQKVNGDSLKVVMTWGKFAEYIDNEFLTPPLQVLDESGIPRDKFVDFKMSIDFSDLGKIQRSLAPYGLILMKEDRLMDCITIENL